eukprot:scaffold237508_cov24-Prasinocladus_malaysianus.AAC.1
MAFANECMLDHTKPVIYGFPPYRNAALYGNAVYAPAQSLIHCMRAILNQRGHVFAIERSRLNSEMRKEMDAESLKIKDKATGEVWWQSINLIVELCLSPEVSETLGACRCTVHKMHASIVSLDLTRRHA